MSDSGGGFFRGFILGGLIGGVLGVLLAPKSGSELRGELGEEAEKLFAQTRSDLENARKAAVQSFEEGRNKIIEKMKPVTSEVPVAEEEKPIKEEPQPRRKSVKR